MIEYPLSPGLSRAVIYSAMLGCEGLILPVAAMLSVENVFSTAGSKKQRLAASQVHMKLAEDAGGTNDFATLLYVYKQCHSRWASGYYNNVDNDNNNYRDGNFGLACMLP